MSAVLVVKVGGSLLDWPELADRLDDYLTDLRFAGRRVVLLVGGGTAADWVRAFDKRFDLGEERAHHLAIRALDLTAHAIVALAPTLGLTVVESLNDLDAAWRHGRTPVLAVRRFLDAEDRGRRALPHTWDVTSDSIAARVSERLRAGLVLLKSAPLPEDADRLQAAVLGLVDPAFPWVSRGLDRVVYRNFRDPSSDEREF